MSNQYWIVKNFSLFCCAMFFSITVFATNLIHILVNNSNNLSQVRLTFESIPIYVCCSYPNKKLVSIDFKNISGITKGLPLIFNGKNLIKKVYSESGKIPGSTRIIFQLTQQSKFKITRKGNILIFILTKENLVNKKKKRIKKYLVTHHTKNTTWKKNKKIVIAIDPGHGGKDPGAIGMHFLKEKIVTLSIAKKIKKRMDNDQMFLPVLTRDKDYFISVEQRSEIARKKNARLLVSIHADSAPNRSARGASVWVLSNLRAQNELGRWLEHQEKQSELLGGSGDILANSKKDKYLTQTVLDLQFGHSQRVGYKVALQVIHQIEYSLGKVHKSYPEHASFGVLRSPDIPSLLVETGFISNSSEEKLLRNPLYQEKLADAIYQGIRRYFISHPI